MYDLLAYGSMMADRGRTAAYARAIDAAVQPGSVVLDIGTGAGIMALLACRAGAARVYAVDPGAVIDVARDVAAANGFADRIRFVQSASTDIDLPEPVDGVVAEIHGVLPLFRRSVVSLLDARARFLKPSGWMIPRRETLWAALVSSPAAHATVLGAWDNVCGFDFRPAATRAVHQPRRYSFAASELASSPCCWAALEYLTLQSTDVRGTVTLSVESAAIVHGLAIWFDAETGPDAGFSNSPTANVRHIFQQLFMPWPKPVALAAGATVDVEIRADFMGEEYALTWTSHLDDAGCRREFRQSSAFADLLGPAMLKNRSPEHVPVVGPDARADRRIIERLETGMKLGDIAEEVRIEFPALFADWNAAMARVGALSVRYSR